MIGGDVAEHVADLKTRSGRELQVHGSGVLAQTLLREDLVDELRLLVYPVVLGTGRRLFAEGTRPAALRLLESGTTSSGVTVNVYESAGKPDYGSFELDSDGSADRSGAE